MAIEAKYTYDKKLEMMKLLQASLVMQSEEPVKDLDKLVFAPLVSHTAHPWAAGGDCFCSLGLPKDGKRHFDGVES